MVLGFGKLYMFTATSTREDEISVTTVEEK